MKIRHYLIASETNDYKPWIITPSALAVFCLVIWSLRFLIPASITLAQEGISASELMNRINQERSQRFLGTLNTNSKLITAATGKANDMIARSYFAHVDPDGKYVWPRIEATGYTPYLTLGENLAMDFTDASGVVNAWMNSPTHRANIVNEKFVDQGLASIAGLYEPNHDTVMVVSLFGTLYKTSSSTPAPRPAPSPKPTPTPPPPVTKPVIKNPPSTTSNLKISNDIKVSNTTLSGKTTVDVDVVIAGDPTLVTATLNGQSITLLEGSVKGQFVGRFTFDADTDLHDKNLHIEARDKNNIKAGLDYLVNFVTQAVEDTPAVGNANTQIPISNEARLFQILRIIFGIFATIYMGFLAIDAIIVHRTKFKRPGIQPNSHLLVFVLVVAITLFTSWS
ncbi:MAG: CAP domain-containing protein [Candidatus Doudnabacteria bacterium]|nr:CAP domain-containing protein [Candidatus Doudnabacteria bacterium]